MNNTEAIFDPNGKMMELLWKPIHIMFLNLLWVLFSLPMVTIGASTTALYSVLIKMRNGKEGKLFLDFWDAFRKNFRQATVIWLIIALAAVVFTTDIVYFVNMGDLTGTVFAMHNGQWTVDNLCAANSQNWRHSNLSEMTRDPTVLRR